MRATSLKSALLLCAITLACPTTALHAATIFSENFDELTAQLAVTSIGPFSAINGTNVDIVGPGDGFGALCAGPESGNCVDLSGSGGNSQGQLALTTPLVLAPGVYDLSFELIGSQRGDTTSTTVTFGSYSQTFVLTSGDDADGIVVNQAVTIAGGPTQLMFVDNSPNDNIGALLDNISISTAGTSAPPGTVPEPETLGLMATGLLGAAGMLRRRFR
jgi:hypothetical protein